MGDVHDHDPEAFDELLSDAEVHVTKGNRDIAVTVTVPAMPGPWTA